MARSARKMTRNVRRERQEPIPEVKPKFLEQREFTGMAFKPQGESQIEGARYLREGRKIVVLQGPAGGGKSILAAWHAANLLKKGKINKLYLVRPYEPCGRSMGAIPGTETEKMSVIFKSILGHLEKFLGPAQLAYDLDKGRIEFKPVEWMRGTSFGEGEFVLCEEAQGFDTDLMQMITTRVGDGAQLCMTGDERQKDIRKKTGLSYLNEQIKQITDSDNPPHYLDEEDLDEIEQNIGFVNFTFEDSAHRGKLTKALVKMFYYEE